MNNPSLADLNRLIEEVSELVKDRCSAFVIIAKTDLGDSDSIAHTYDGGRSTALGLTEVFRMEMQAQINRETQSTREEE